MLLANILLETGNWKERAFDSDCALIAPKCVASDELKQFGRQEVAIRQ